MHEYAILAATAISMTDPHQLALNGRTEQLVALLDAGAVPIDAATDEFFNGQTLLHCAAARGHALLVGVHGAGRVLVEGVDRHERASPVEEDGASAAGCAHPNWALPLACGLASSTASARPRPMRL